MFAFRCKQIGLKIAYYRRLQSLTQAELARRINISDSTLGKIECGKYNKNLSLAMLMNIAEGLGVDVIMLIDVDKRENVINNT